MEDFPSRYDHKENEQKIYELWEKSGYFNPDNCIKDGVTEKNAEAFSMVLPPPNVTGELHIGHAFEHTIQDIAIRFARMRGKRTLWVPGTDHAAIATQSKVEKELIKTEKVSRRDLGREEFLRRVNAFAKSSHDTIVRQIKRLGASLDWSREAYTLDEKRELAVRTAFKKLYDMGLIYRGNRVVNWDPKGQTVISDDEVVHEERKAKFYTFRYSKDFPIAISTTRPETKVGDTAVAVHPDDARYKKFVGKEYDISFCGVPLHIKIIADPSVEKDFGTGALGVTPAHSTVDWEMAQRHNLPLAQVIDERGRMMIDSSFDSAQDKPFDSAQDKPFDSAQDKPLRGLKTTEAREWITEELRKEGLLEKEEEITQNISTAERSGAIIEPLPKLQWFMSVNKKFKVHDSRLKNIKSGEEVTLKDLMKRVVESGEIKIIPERFEKTYFHWIENLRDWCISRQLWFGHQVPVWYHEAKCVPKTANDKEQIVSNVNEMAKCEEVVVTNKNEKPICQFCDAKYIQDQDTLDTWFSSGMWTFSTLGWPFDSAQGKPTSAKATEDKPTSAKDTENEPTNAETAKDKPTRHELGPENDIANYYPNTLMAPGYEILFFWVARMILMSGSLLGEIPFRTVLLHGIVRDIHGKKFSKSAANGIEPIALADKYGADAIRMALIVSAAPGGDVKFDEGRIKGYRNFATKAWNVARFIQMNEPEGVKNIDVSERPEAKELASLKDEVAAHIENFEFHLAAEKTYHYTWHTLADKIIETEKKNLKDGSVEQKSKSYALLKHLLTESLKVLHPFMPFVTEEIYQKLEPNKLLMVEKW